MRFKKKKNKLKYMKIAICSSASFVEKAKKIKEFLEKHGIDTSLPPCFELQENELKELLAAKERCDESYLKKKTKFLQKHLENVANSDAILVLNYDKKGIKNYIGGSTFLEMGLAFFLKKKIFLLNSIPDRLPYSEEIKTMKPIILHGDIRKILSEI